jgi:DNA-binding beta-propeller fold protein YncE
MRMLRIGPTGGATVMVAVAALAVLIAEPQPQPQRPAGPAFQVDPFWPKPLPNHWLYGSITGVTVDRRDHVWVVHRGGDSLNARTEMSAATNPPTAETCCLPAPAVLEFDPSGKLMRHWGGPGQGYDWPGTPGGIAVDSKSNVWIAAAGWPDTVNTRPRDAPPEKPRPIDAHVLKFSGDGKFLMQIGAVGKPGGNASTTGLHRPAALDVDAAGQEVYVADGFTNRRVVVFDAETGAYKRHWGAYGSSSKVSDTTPDDSQVPPLKQFRSVACVRLANDGLVYVCDRRNNRIQVFKKDGAFVKETFVSKATLGEGSVWAVAFSRDPQQQFLYVADGQNQKVHVLQRETLEVLSSFGAGGRWPGAFFGVGSVAVDSKGNLITGETFEGKRVQRFLLKKAS